MFRKLVCIFAFFIYFCTPLFSYSEYSIVFIHIGKQLPPYAEIAFKQAREFNPDCAIILLASEEALINRHEDPNLNLELISCESLVKTSDHLRFIQDSTLDRQWAGGFWIHTSQRFMYLNDLMIQYGLKNVFHLEYDNMLYADLSELLPAFHGSYQGIAGTFDNDERCIAGFIYIPNCEVMSQMAKCFADCAGRGSVAFNDQGMITHFKNLYGKDFIDYLPVISEEYVNHNNLVSPMGQTVQDKYRFCQNLDVFDSIFDGAALGQYMGGVDPIHGSSNPGFINERCVFNPSLLAYEWTLDDRGRNIPYIVYQNKRLRINNLHIHSKRLALFASKNYQ